ELPQRPDAGHVIRGHQAFALGVVPACPQPARLLQQQELELGVAAGGEALADAVRRDAQGLGALPPPAQMPPALRPPGARAEEELPRAVVSRVLDQGPRLA